MKLVGFLIVSTFNAILWTSIKTTPIRRGLARQFEKDYMASKTLNDGAESSVNPQIQKDKEELNPKLDNTEKDKGNGGEKVSNRSDYYKEYYRKNKERLLKNSRNYRKLNKEKVSETNRNYYIRNKERIKSDKKVYYQENKKKYTGLPKRV
ncbi:unnamed protein product [Meloidogyne enterolobii]|uniref:Uncharacterized protein n=1 Tax=Meloidogyne enterolobii TaxID=390850 RepID=A0ACB0YC58_MELEN